MRSKASLLSTAFCTVRLRNAYVIKAERVEKDANGEITTIFCTYDPETLGKNPADGRKVKGGNSLGICST